MEIMDSQAVGGIPANQMDGVVLEPVVALIQDAITSSTMPQTNLLDIPDALMKLDAIRYGLDVPYHADRIADLCNELQSHSSISIQKARELMVTLFPPTMVRLSSVNPAKKPQSSYNSSRHQRNQVPRSESGSLVAHVITRLKKWVMGD